MAALKFEFSEAFAYLWEEDSKKSTSCELYKLVHKQI